MKQFSSESRGGMTPTLGALTAGPSGFERSTSHLVGSVGPTSFGHSPLGGDAGGFAWRPRRATWFRIREPIVAPRKGDVLIHRTCFVAQPGWSERGTRRPYQVSVQTNQLQGVE